MSARILEMDACDLVGRLVTNPNGVEHVVTRLSFDARDGRVLVWVVGLANGRALPLDSEAGLPDLEGWTIHQRIRR